MNKRKQIITDVLLNDNFSNVQESMNTLGFTKLQQYVDYLDDCYSHVTNLEHFREQLLTAKMRERIINNIKTVVLWMKVHSVGS